MSEELTLVGILAERDFDQTAVFTVKDIKKIFFECLQLQPMYEPLLKCLEQEGKIWLQSQAVGSSIKLSPDQVDELHNQKVLFRDIDRAVNSSNYLKITPRVSQQHTCVLIT